MCVNSEYDGKILIHYTTFKTLFESIAQKIQIFDEELKVLRLKTKRNNINAIQQ